MSLRCLIDFPRDNAPRLQSNFRNPVAVLQAYTHAEVLPLLSQVDRYARQGFWVVGMVAYEAAPAFDLAFPRSDKTSPVPLAGFLVFEQATAPDTSSGTFSCSPWREETSQTAFENLIPSIRADIAAGSYYQTNLTRRVCADFSGDAESFFQALREAQPDSYGLFLDFGAWQIASVSPELFFAWDAQSGKLTTRPMKGTAPLDHSVEFLRASVKDRAENLMIVDLLRNDISRIATDVQVPDLFAVQTLSTARQMTSTITGITRAGISMPDIFTALFPCGSITGTPKIAAMQAIQAYESSPRGIYCGALGVVQPGGGCLFSVGIRSVILSGTQAVCGVGCGITWDSVPGDEYNESQIKQRFLWRASAGFDLVETMGLKNGVYARQERHLARLKKSTTYFGFIYDEAHAVEALVRVAQESPSVSYRVRILVSRKGNIRTEVYPLGSSPTLVNIGLAARAVDSTDEFLRHKTTHREIYDSVALQDEKLFDTLLINERREITEFTRGNVAVEIDGLCVTPDFSPARCAPSC